MEAKTSGFLPPRPAQASVRRGHGSAGPVRRSRPPRPPAQRRAALRLRDCPTKFALEAPSGETDFRFIDGTGSKKDGRLYIYDAAGGRILEYAKRDGRLIGEWATGPGSPRGRRARHGRGGGRQGRTLDRGLDDARWALRERAEYRPDRRPPARGGPWTAQVVGGPTPVGTAESRRPRGAIRSPSGVSKTSGAGQTGRAEEQAEVRRLVERDHVAATDIELLSAAGRSRCRWKAIDWQTPSSASRQTGCGSRRAGKRSRGRSRRPSTTGLEGDRGEYNAEWREHDREMRLWFFVEADDTHWWVNKIYTYDGSEERRMDRPTSDSRRRPGRRGARAWRWTSD